MQNEEMMLAEALAFAAKKHEGQTRRNGTPYIYHPLTVAAMVKECGFGIPYQIVALLHDTLEDTDATEEEIAKFGSDILESVRLLTRRPGMDERIYVADILKNEMAAVVKNADKVHNLRDILSEGQVASIKYGKKADKYYRGLFSKALDDATDDALLWKKPDEKKVLPEILLKDMELYSARKEKMQKQILYCGRYRDDLPACNALRKAL